MKLINGKHYIYICKRVKETAIIKRSPILKDIPILWSYDCKKCKYLKSGCPGGPILPQYMLFITKEKRF